MKTLLPKSRVWIELFEDIARPRFIYEQFPEMNPPPPPSLTISYQVGPIISGCFMEWKIVFSNSLRTKYTVMQFVLDFYQTPSGRHTSRTGGLAHPVNILVFLVHFEINDHSNKLVETRGVADTYVLKTHHHRRGLYEQLRPSKVGEKIVKHIPRQLKQCWKILNHAISNSSNGMMHLQ